MRRRPEVTLTLLVPAGLAGFVALGASVAELGVVASAYPAEGSAAPVVRDFERAGALELLVEREPDGVNDPPTVRIVSPVAMTQFPADERVTLLAEARDPEDGDLGDSVRWSSSRDGSLGSGASRSIVLSVGVHTLTAHARDSAGLVERASVDVRVTAAGHVLLAAGDIASCSSAGDEATAAVLDRRFGSVVTLGDNAYPKGTLAEFQSCYGPSWGRHKARTRPAAGNHEYGTDGASGHFAYFGAAAGEPNQGWYSYDVGSWHIVVLNSNCKQVGGCTRTSPQGLWLEADLAANPRDCTLAVWHHPHFSSGSEHGSSRATRRRLIRTVVDVLTSGPPFGIIRASTWPWADHARMGTGHQRALPSGVAALYDTFHSHGGDVILSAHDHNYERFAPQDAFGVADPNAPRQFVVGTGGAGLRPMGEIQPNSVTDADHAYGVLELALHEGSYDWEFVPAAGSSYSDSGSASCAVGGVGRVEQLIQRGPAGGVPRAGASAAPAG